MFKVGPMLSFLGLLAQTVWSLWPTAVVDPCSELTSLSLENTTILNASHVHAGSNIPTPGSCQSSAIPTVDVCRVYGVVNTTADSAVKFEIWLPDIWYGRFLGVGNGELGGCIAYSNIDYGASMHFATIGSDNGHDGDVGLPFLDHPEVINDFAYRAIHTEAIIGKQIVEAYYENMPSKSYFLGCSTGGRQAFQSALLYPDDFDGLVGGAPAVDWNHLIGWIGLLWKYTVTTNPGLGSGFITDSLWQIVSQEILKQCDGLDGLLDGIISEPDDCNFNAAALLCAKDSTEGCLTQSQVDVLNKVYRPIYGFDGELLYPRYDPGSEADPSSQAYFSGNFPLVPEGWMKYAVYNDSMHSLEDFGLSDIECASATNSGGIATWNGDLSSFRNRGGKFLTYHGRRDTAIASGISKRLHDLVSSTLSPHAIDDFYRLFLVPGLNHCVSGPGAWAFGQGGPAFGNVINDTAHNILLAIVDWVEGGIPPPSITGVDDNRKERTHCLYPQKSVWSGTEWLCVSS